MQHNLQNQIEAIYATHKFRILKSRLRQYMQHTTVKYQKQIEAVHATHNLQNIKSILRQYMQHITLKISKV